MPPRAPGPHPYLEPEPSAADPAPVRDPPQSAPAASLPARRRAAEAATRTGQPRPEPHVVVRPRVVDDRAEQERGGQPDDGGGDDDGGDDAQRPSVGDEELADTAQRYLVGLCLLRGGDGPGAAGAARTCGFWIRGW